MLSRIVFSGALLRFAIAQRIGVSHTNVPALREDNAQEEEEQEYAGAYPAVGCVWGRGIKVGLVLLMRKA